MKRKSSVLPLLALVAVLASCYPNGPESTEEFDAVVTAVDPTAKFGPLTTFAIPDSVQSITENGGEEHDHSVDAQIIARIVQNMTDRGYTQIPLDLTNNPPDMLLAPGIATFKNYDAYSTSGWYGGWNWWGDWGVGYPWYSSGAVYSYSVGTLVVMMIDAKDITPQTEDVTALWAGAANGLVESNRAQMTSRVNKAIDQMWAQSPYIQKAQ